MIQQNTRSKWHANLQSFVESLTFQNTIVFLIIVNAITLGLETVPAVMSQHGVIIKWLDFILLKIFTVEILLKIFVYRRSFLKNKWRAFDFIIVSLAYLPAGEILTSLRTLRILRLISAFKSMRRVIEGLLKAIPGMLSVCTIMGLVFYIYAVIGSFLFGDVFPLWFGHLGRSMFTLFQIMTLESWSMGIVRPVMELYPFAWIYFVSYILVTTFTMLNLFIAIIVNAMHQNSIADHEAQRSHQDVLLTDKLNAIEKKMLDAIEKN